MTKESKGNGGQQITMCGHTFTVRPSKIIDPYERMMIEISGLTPIAGPTAPNLDTYVAMLRARVKNGLLAQELMDELLAQIRGRQVEVAKSDANGDATNEIIVKTVSASIHVFARDEEGVLGLQAYALHAAVRECFSESGFFKKNHGMRERFREGMGIGPWFLRLERNGKPLTVADSIQSRPVHVWSGGKKSDSICQFEQVNVPWTIKAMLEVRHDSILKLQDVVSVLSVLPTVRLGAQRSMEFGGCRVTSESDIMTVQDSMALGKVAAKAAQLS